MKRYVIIAGVNGAGKSTLFSTISSLEKIEKINFDDVARELGEWNDRSVSLKAGKTVIKAIDDYIDKGISFSRETLGGHGVSERDIERRYVETFINLRIVLPQCNLAILYDNTKYLSRFAIYIDGEYVHCSNNVPEWYSKLLK